MSTYFRKQVRFYCIRWEWWSLSKDVHYYCTWIKLKKNWSRAGIGRVRVFTKSMAITDGWTWNWDHGWIGEEVGYVVQIWDPSLFTRETITTFRNSRDYDIKFSILTEIGSIGIRRVGMRRWREGRRRTIWRGDWRLLNRRRERGTARFCKLRMSIQLQRG